MKESIRCIHWIHDRRLVERQGRRFSDTFGPQKRSMLPNWEALNRSIDFPHHGKSRNLPEMLIIGEDGCPTGKGAGRNVNILQRDNDTFTV